MGKNRVEELSREIKVGLLTLDRKIDDLKNDLEHKINDLEHRMNDRFSKLEDRMEYGFYEQLKAVGGVIFKGDPAKLEKVLDPEEKQAAKAAGFLFGGKK